MEPTRTIFIELNDNGIQRVHAPVANAEEMAEVAGLTKAIANEVQMLNFKAKAYGRLRRQDAKAALDGK